MKLAHLELSTIVMTLSLGVSRYFLVLFKKKKKNHSFCINFEKSWNVIASGFICPLAGADTHL